MSPKVILSVFDRTGEWARPWAEAGHEVVALDLEVEGDVADVRKFSVEYLIDTLGLDDVDGILAAPPCTDFTNAGAQYWPAKDRDGRTAASVELVLQALRCVEYFQPDWWVLENPIGRLAQLVPELGAPRLRFDPWEFAGWGIGRLARRRLERLRRHLEAGGRATRADCELVLEAGAYTKRTQLWGDFALPERRPIAPVRVCAQGSPIQRFGGSSDATKHARSVTPTGFARAFFAANDWTPAREREIEQRRRDRWAAENLPDTITRREREAALAAEFGD